MKTLLIHLGLIQFFRGERDDFLIKFSLLYFSVYFSGQELDSMVYHDNYNGKFLLAQILPHEFSEKSIFRKNIQTCQGLPQEGTMKACPRS